MTQSLRPQGKPLTDEEKWLVINVYLRCREESLSSGTPITKVYERTSHYLGISRKVVVGIISHYRKTGTVPPPAQAGNKTYHKTLIDLNAASSIRKHIFNCHRDGAACDAKHIQDLLESDFNLKLNLRTVQRTLLRLGFEYIRNKPRLRSLREKDEIRQQRHTYLHQIREFRNSGYQVIYFDESFIHHHHGQQFSWFQDGDYIERATGKGRRWCFIHAMCCNNLINDCFLIFEGKKSTGDYHGSFNFEVFHSWFKEKLIPNLPKKSCIVMDRATYHMVPEERLIISEMKKKAIQDWLTHHGISWEEHWLKPKLLETLENHIDRTPIVQKEALSQGHQLLVLPVHHPELNPIELIWGIVKNKCAKKLRNGVSFQDVKLHLKNELENLSTETCQNVYQHVQQIENQFWELEIECDTD